MFNYSAINSPIQRRKFLPKGFQVSDWESLEPWYNKLLQSPAHEPSKLEKLIEQASELQAAVSDAFAWHFIRMSCDNQHPEKVKAYQDFVEQINPRVSACEDKLNRYILASPAFDQLDEARYFTFQRGLRREIEVFSEKNLPLITEIQSLGRQYGAISGAAMIEYEGKSLTLQQAAIHLEDPDRSKRETVWRMISARRSQDYEQLETLFEQLLSLRVQAAQNAGYESFTDYRLASMSRFDYSPEDCYRFHEAIEAVATPIYNELLQYRKKRLGLTSLRPWDMQLGLSDGPPLRPFQTAAELIEGCITLLNRLSPEIGAVLRQMQDKGHLDLESRAGKSPGGFNYPMLEGGLPFVFMNAAGSQRDLTVLLHESGHALQSWLLQDLRLNTHKAPPSEIAELAAMSMELLGMEHYEVFYSKPEERKRAQREQLYRCLMILPWIATVDAFQHWVYAHPDHSREERAAKWLALYHRFHGKTLDHSGLEENLSRSWMNQGHVYEAPFYYIEYGIAQLGALSVWRNYRLAPEQGLQAYLNALRMGYTRPIPEVYEAAQLRFDFSQIYLEEIIRYCYEAWQSLDDEASAS